MLTNSQKTKPDLDQIDARSMPDLVRIDGRSAVARKIKTTAAQLKRELDLGRRLSFAEAAAVESCATATVMADEAMKRAMLGEVPIADAVRSVSTARRAKRDLKSIKPHEEQLPSYDELMAHEEEA